MPVPESPKNMRTDARLNREKLLAAAVVAFARDGADASLEGIARQAGVGTGTLYRHFPTRNDLIEEAYRNEVEQLRQAADDLLADNPPDVALAEWMDRFVDYASAKLGMKSALQEVMSSSACLVSNAREQITEAVTVLLEAGIDAGTLRRDTTPEDVLNAMGSIWLINSDQWPEQPRRVLGLLMDGLRYGALL